METANAKEIIRATKLSKVFGEGNATTWALRDVTFTVAPGEFIGVMGPSGSGKTTLLNLAAAIDVPTSGTIAVNGINLASLNDRDLAILRRRNLGFIFQDYNLLHTLSVKENILLPLALDNVKPDKMEERLSEVASRLDIGAILPKRIFQVSGGEQQRAAIARAIIHDPAVILADEPTGNLDSRSSSAVMKSLGDLNANMKATILLVTHDPLAASYCTRILFIKDGRIESELHRTGQRRSFYQEILGELRLQGGEEFDALPTRPE